MRWKTAVAAASLILANCVNANEAPPQFVEVPPPPPAQVPDEGEEVDPGLEPEATIIQRRDATYEEYRVNGRLFMVKVVPTVGKPYFYVDRDGDGLMESRMNDYGWDFKVPQWVIFSW